MNFHLHETFHILSQGGSGKKVKIFFIEQHISDVYKT